MKASACCGPHGTRRFRALRELKALFCRRSEIGAVRALKSGTKLRRKPASPKNALTSTTVAGISRSCNVFTLEGAGRIPSLPIKTPKNFTSEKVNKHLLKPTE